MLEAPPQTAWVLIGATATGKTAVAHLLALAARAVVVSADALLVYRGMDVGTAKPTAAERAEVPYLGVDVFDPDAPGSAGAWLAAVREGLRDPALAGRPVIVAGGTGLYVQALLAGLEGPASDPAARARWQALADREGAAGLLAALRTRDPAGADRLAAAGANPRHVARALERLDADGGTADGTAAHTPSWARTGLPTVAGLRRPRPARAARIAARIDAMYAAGLVDEARTLRTRFPRWSVTAAAAIGYAEALACADGVLAPDEARARTAARTRQLAKRQDTWFRHQIPVAWVDAGEGESVDALAARVLAVWREHGPARLAV